MPSQYDLMRQRAQQQGTAAKQEELEAVKRRAAAQGMVNSGAYEKQAQLVGDQAERRTQEAVQNVDFQETQQKEAREYQTSEREAGQRFQGEQAGLQRGFLTQERLGGQDFASLQANLQRLFQTSERTGSQDFTRDLTQSEREAGQEFARGERMGAQEFARGEREGSQLFNRGLFDADMKFKQTVFKAEQGWKHLDNVFRNKEFEENKKANAINAFIAMYGADIDPGDVNRINFIRDALKNYGISAPKVGTQAPHF